MYFKIIKYGYFDVEPKKIKLSLKEIKKYNYNCNKKNFISYKFINLKNIKFLNDISNKIFAYYEKIKDYSYLIEERNNNKYLTYLDKNAF